MNDKEKRPVLGEVDGRLPLFLFRTRIFKADLGVEEDLTGQFKAHAMLAGIDKRLLRIPNKTLTEIEKVNVHRLNVYILYICLSVKWRQRPGVDSQSRETLEAGVGKNEKRLVEVRGSHPSLEKSEGWATQLYGSVKGAGPAAIRLSINFFSIANLDNVGAQTFVLDFCDDAVISDAILPEISEYRAFKSLTDAARVIQFGHTPPKKLEDTLCNLPV